MRFVRRTCKSRVVCLLGLVCCFVIPFLWTTTSILDSQRVGTALESQTLDDEYPDLQKITEDQYQVWYVDPTESTFPTTTDQSETIISQLSAMPWFHREMTREESEFLLHPCSNGVFLIRESRAFPGNYTLSLCCDGKVEHFFIRNTKDKVTVDGEALFDDLVQLIKHYKTESNGLCTKLGKPLDKARGKAMVPMDKRDDLRIGPQIGKGMYGEVHSGEYCGRKVAIKSLQSKSETALQQYMLEATIMTKLQHPNVVQFIGILLDPKPVLLVTELMHKGSVVDYLKTKEGGDVNNNDLLKFSKDVCAGMVHLESKGIVHRDLSGRNVLVADDNCTAKISDFGLAQNSHVTREGIWKFPTKWTAPEALHGNGFTTKSDVWSFGILLWELYSYGHKPYEDMLSKDVLNHVESGYRMNPPDGCPKEIYDLMKKCWSVKPQERPSFADISHMLSKMSF